MGCNCGDNEYNIEIENNGSCEPTTPIYNISLGGVGVDGYSPTVEFVDKDAASFKIRVNDVNGTTITEAIPLFTYLVDNYVNNSMLASTLTAYSTTEEINAILEDYVTNSSLSTTLEDYVTQDYLNSNFYDATSIDALLQNITNTYLNKNGSNAANPININGLSIQELYGSNLYLRTNHQLQISSTNPVTLNGSSVDITANNIGQIRLLTNYGMILNSAENRNINLTTSGTGKAYYNNKEIATVDQIPTKTSDLTNDSGFLIEGDLVDYAKITDIPTVGNGTITLTQGGVTKGTFTTNQSGNTTIELDTGGSSYTAGNGIDITNNTISIDTSIVATQTDIANKLATTGQNAASNFSVNGSAFTSDATYSMITMSKGGVIANVSDGGNYLFLVDNYSAPQGQIGIGTINGYNTGVVIVGNTTIEGQYINITTSNNGSFQYNNNEVATVNQIPTVNNSTITFTQGGVTKGTITLNQSGDQTIALDAGGSSSIPPIGYGTSDTAAATVQKEISIPEITELSVGQIIVVQPDVTSSAVNSTIKLNNFAAYPMKYNGAAISTSTDSVVWSSAYPSQFIFDGTNWVFLGHGYDANTTYTLNYSLDAGLYKLGTGSHVVTRYSLMMQTADMTWEKITNPNAKYSTATTKTVNTHGFRLGQLKYYSSTSNFATGATIATNIVYDKAASVDMRYSTNCGATPGWTDGDYIYLVGTMGADGLFYLDTTTWWTNTLPNTNDGKLYMRVGLYVNSYAYSCSLLTKHPVFYYDGNRICEYVNADNLSGGGAVIDDNTPSTTTVYSSQKTQDLIDALVARIAALEANINGGNA